jgi:hypothetical protein
MFIAASNLVPALVRVKVARIYTASFGGSDFGGVE